MKLLRDPENRDYMFYTNPEDFQFPEPVNMPEAENSWRPSNNEGREDEEEEVKRSYSDDEEDKKTAAGD